MRFKEVGALMCDTKCCHASMGKGMSASARLPQDIVWERHRKQGEPCIGPGALLQRGIGPLDGLDRSLRCPMITLLQT